MTDYIIENFYLTKRRGDISSPDLKHIFANAEFIVNQTILKSTGGSE